MAHEYNLSDIQDTSHWRIRQDTSAELMGNLANNPHLFAKLDYLAKKNRGKPFHNEFLSEQMNAVPLFNSDKHDQTISIHKSTSPGQYNQHRPSYYTCQQGRVEIQELVHSQMPTNSSLTKCLHPK
jgi:hypothetical protein